MVVDHDVVMIKEVESGFLVVIGVDHASVFLSTILCDETTHRNASRAEGLVRFIVNWVAPCNGHVINDPVMLIAEHHSVLQELHIIIVARIFLLADFFARLFAVKLELVWRWSNSFAEEDLAEIFRWRFFTVCVLAEIERAEEGIRGWIEMGEG